MTVCENPTDDVRQAILAPLAAFNAENGYPADARFLAITLTDPAGKIVGGLWGKTVYDWLFVDYLVVPPSMRGQKFGSKLMSTAERIALDRGCVGSWLTTFPFSGLGILRKARVRDVRSPGELAWGKYSHLPAEAARDPGPIGKSRDLGPQFIQDDIGRCRCGAMHPVGPCSGALDSRFGGSRGNGAGFRR